MGGVLIFAAFAFLGLLVGFLVGWVAHVLRPIATLRFATQRPASHRSRPIT